MNAITTALVFVAALLVTGPAAAQPPPDQGSESLLADAPPRTTIFRLTLATAIVAHALDTATTVDCRARQVCTEANPWLLRYPQPIPFALAKTTVAAVSLWATAAVYERCESTTCRVLATSLNVVQTVAFSTIAIRNARVSR